MTGLNVPSPAPLPPHSIIGILGGGQLAKMLVQAAAELGFRSAIYSDDWGPALDVAGSHLIGPYDNLGRLDEFARGVDVVTYEFENVPVIAAEHLARRVPVRPGAMALRVAQDRAVEKSFIADLGIPVAPFVAIANTVDLAAAFQAMKAWQGPAILKTARLGYDGKGQAGVAGSGDLAAAFAKLGSVPCVLERRIDFAFEISVLVVRGLDGSLACYDAPRNTHEGGILRRSVVPAGLSDATEAQARDIACRIAVALDYVGVLGVEMFCLGADAATAAAGQRDRAARTQLRPLDHGCLRDLPVPEPYPRCHRLAARFDAAAQRCRDAQPHRPRRRRLARAGRRRRRVPPSLRQARGALRSQDGPRHAADAQSTLIQTP